MNQKSNYSLYARRNLWSDILAVGSDYIYADTDSIKLLNYEKHRDYFDEYNVFTDDETSVAKEVLQ